MAYRPGVSDLTVVIATLGRPAILARTLSRLEGQANADSDFEVVVASDAAESDLSSVRQAIANRPYPVRHVAGKRPGVSATRNAGWRAATTDLVLFIGDDMLPNKNLVAEHLRLHERHPEPEVAGLGLVRWARELRTTAFMVWLDHGIQFDYPSIRNRGPAWWHLYAANASLERSRLELIGGFDEDFRFGYEELDLARRLDEIGLRVIYEPKAVVEHLHPPTMESWRSRMRIVARAERQFIAKHPGTTPYFLELFEEAMTWPPARGRMRRLIPWIPRRFPVLGPRAWGSADAYFRQQLAPAFLEQWHGGDL